MNQTSTQTDPAVHHHALENMDAYVPEGSGGRPAVVFIHGGGWQKGSREQFQDHAKRMAAMGYVTATVSYRLSDVAKWPAQLEDVRKRMREVVAHAKDWGIDTARIAVVGSSAGAHLAACLATRPGDEALRPACVVGIHGCYDCTRRTEMGSLINLLGDYEQFTDRWLDASSVRFVDEQTPAMLLTHDPNDPTVPYDQSVLMVNALVRAHRPVAFIPTPGSGHGFVYALSNTWAQRLWPDVVAYIDQQLGG